MTDTALENRVAAMEGRQQGLDTFLPAFLGRFEGMESRIDDRLEALTDDRRSAKWAQYSIAAALFGIFLALIGLIVVLAAG